MAQIQQEIINFDINPQAATAQIDAMINKLNALQAEFNQLEKEGKDVSAVQRQIAQTTAQLNTALSQETKTMQGLTTQTKALANSQNALEQSTKKTSVAQELLTRNNARTASAFARAANSAKSLAGGLTGTIAAFTGFGGVAVIATKAVDALVTATIEYFTAQEEVITISEDVKDITKAIAQEYAGEQMKLDALFGPLQNVNLASERRVELINQIKEAYPGLLDDIDLENASLQDLAKAYERVRREVFLQAVEKARQSKVQEAAAKALDIQFQLVEAEQELAKKQQTADLERGRAFEDGRKLSDEAIAAQDKAIASRTKLVRELQAQERAAVAEAQKVNDITLAIVNAFDSGKISGFNFGQALTDVGNSASKSAKSTNKAKAEYQLLSGSLAALEKQLSELEKKIKEQTRFADTETLATLGKQYQDLKKQVEEARAAVDEALTPRTTLVPIELEVIPILPEKLPQGTSPLEVEVRPILIDDAQAAERSVVFVEGLELKRRRELEQSYALDLQLAGDNAQKIEQVNKEYAAKRELLENQSSQRILQARIKATQAALNQENDPEQIQKLRNDIERLNIELLGLQGTEIKLETTQAEENISRLKERILSIASGIQDLSNQALEFFKAQAQRTVQQYDGAVQKQQQALDQLLANQENASVQAVEIENQRLQNLEKERQKAAEQEARITQIQIAANAALAIARAAAEGGGLASAITIASTIASLAFGFAAARQQAEQAFFEGTTYVERKGAPKGRDTIKARLNEGEAVIPTSTNAKYSDAIHAIYHERIPADFLNAIARAYPNMPFGVASIAAEANSKGLVLNGRIANKSRKSSNDRYLRQIAQNTAANGNSSISITEKGLVKTVQGRIQKDQKTRKKMS